MSDGTDNSTQSSEKEGDGDDQSLYFQEQADVIHDLAGMLVHDVSGDDRFWRFQAIAFHAANAFGDLPGTNLLESIKTEEGRIELLANPAAAPLLAYFVLALQRFNATRTWDGVAEAKTDELCRLLAKAFCLLGRPGERRPKLGEAGNVSLLFQQVVSRAIASRGLKEGAPLSVKDRRSISRDALREVYRVRHGCSYDYMSDADKERMRRLRQDLADFGWDVTL